MIYLTDSFVFTPDYCVNFKAMSYELTSFNRKGADRSHLATLGLRLHGVIYRPNSFVLVLRYCANLKTIGYESTSLNKIVADKSHRVVIAYFYWRCHIV